MKKIKKMKDIEIKLDENGNPVEQEPEKEKKKINGKAVLKTLGIVIVAAVTGIATFCAFGIAMAGSVDASGDDSSEPGDGSDSGESGDFGSNSGSSGEGTGE